MTAQRTNPLLVSFEVTGVILAAGASTRLGQPKQLLRHHERTLLQRIGQEALACGLTRSAVVLGCNYQSIRPTLQGMSLEIVVNPRWRDGLATSIQTAVQWFQEHTPDAKAILFMASDQILIDRVCLHRILSEFDGDPDRIIVAQYGETKGIPALFGVNYLTDLLALTGDRGAQSLIRRYRSRVREVPLQEAALDIDRWEDWETFLASDTMRS